jgi:hypothetical protein
MSLRLVSKIIITQLPTTAYPNRNKVYTLDFVNFVNIKSSWKNLTTTAKVIFPRSIYIKDANGTTNWVSKSTYTPNKGNTDAPILLRGDKISINLGYYYNPGNGYKTQMNEEFNGYITKVNPKMPMELECEDSMWLLKQAQCPNKVFKSSEYDTNSIIQYLLDNPVLPKDTSSKSYKYVTEVIAPALKNIKIFNGEGTSMNVKTNVGEFRTQNETIAMVLQRLRKDYKIECFFRPQLTNGKPTDWNSLYVSGIVYYSSDYLNSNGMFQTIAYGFQQNITDNGDNLQYTRKDDVRLGIKAYSVGKYKQTTTNESGGLTTKSKRLEVSVGDTDGDIRTQFFWPNNENETLDLDTLTKLAEQRLNKMKFEGWRGSFESFGLPYVQHGMAISLNDVVMSGANLQNGEHMIMERQGIYLVKGTEVNFGMNGFRRKNDLHLRLDGQDYKTEDFKNGL